VNSSALRFLVILASLLALALVLTPAAAQQVKSVSGVVVNFGLMTAEVFLPVYGSLGIGGAIAFVVGSVMLIDTEAAGFGVPLPLILGIAATSAAFLIGVGGLALKARRLVFMSDVPGFLRDPKDDSTLMTHLRAMEVPEIRQRLTDGGFDVVASSPEEFLKFVQEMTRASHSESSYIQLVK